MSVNGQRRTGRLLGRLAWWLKTRPARVTETNLRVCFPEAGIGERRELARRSLEHTGQLLCESGITFHWPESRWRALAVEVQGAELIESARAAGRGVLILVPHLGNWEYLGLHLGHYGVTALYDPPRNPALEPLIRASRSRTGATLLPIGAAGLRGFYRALQHGGVAALLPDQVPDRQAGVYADFFGIPALTMTLAHRLLRRSDALVLLGSAVRCTGGFRIAYEVIPDDIRHPDPVASARVMNHAIEKLVRAYPDQYQWEYKRFKGQPRELPSLYARRG